MRGGGTGRGLAGWDGTVMAWSDGAERWRGAVAWRWSDGAEGWRGRMARTDGAEGWRGRMARTEGAERWRGRMARSDGAEGGRRAAARTVAGGERSGDPVAAGALRRRAWS